jgi:hypothetical protein
MVKLKTESSPVTVKIDSQKYWNATGIYLETGAIYTFEVKGGQWIYKTFVKLG